MSKHIFLGNDRIVTKQVALGTGETYDNADTAVEKLYTYYYHADHLGSTSVVTDHNGEVYERLEYTPYGETWLDETSGNTYFDTPYRFSAKEKDEETGLYYYGARYLDPKYSRWISADPALGDYLPQAPVNDEAKKHNQSLPGQGGVFNVINLNLYHYAGNNPIKYTDPDGNYVWLVVAVIAVNNSLSGIYYNDGKNQTTVMRNPYSNVNSSSITLDSHPIIALGSALPRGMYSESDYEDKNQLKGANVQNVSTVLGGLGLIGSIMENLSEGHAGDVKFNYTKQMEN
jgi:RHS repeat-associated protein